MVVGVGRLVRLGALMLALFALVGVAGLSASAQEDGGEVVVPLNELNGSGVSGEAILTDNGDGTTTVDILVDGATGGHPAHIHAGTCSELGDIVFPLADVDETGSSITDVEASLSDILAAQHAINVHLSAEEITTYVACGEIASSTGGQTTAAQTTATETATAETATTATETATTASASASPAAVGGNVTTTPATGIGTTQSSNMAQLGLIAFAIAAMLVAGGVALQRREVRR